MMPAGEESAAPEPSVRQLTIQTEDGVTLQAEEWTLSKEAQPAAGILLIHSFGNTRKTWGPFPTVLARAGYRVLAIDLRGHGGSTPLTVNPARLLDDPNLAPRDMRASLAWLRAAPGADPSRLAVIGASVGADLACVAGGRGLVRTSVALSPDRDRVHRLAGGGGPLHLQSVFFMATSGDSDAESFARRLSLETKPPKKVQVFTRAAEHGEAILAAHPEAAGMILDWLHRTL